MAETTGRRVRRKEGMSALDRMLDELVRSVEKMSAMLEKSELWIDGRC